MKILSHMVLSSIVAGALFTPARGQSQVLLQGDSMARGEIVRLSDLLPGGAPETLRQLATAVELGRAPQPGSRRNYTGAEIRRQIEHQPGLLRQLLIPDRLTVGRAACALQRDAIANAVSSYLRSRGWPEDGMPTAATLRWPDSVRALRENPRLEVEGMNWNGVQQTIEIRVRCADRSECSNFLVETQGPKGLAAPGRSRATSASANPFAATQQPIGAISHATGAVLAQAGKPAMLILERGNMRISLPVLCLERGRLRQQVRARDRAGHRIYRAEVVGENLLHAIF